VAQVVELLLYILEALNSNSSPQKKKKKRKKEKKCIKRVTPKFQLDNLMKKKYLLQMLLVV
jgi:hypothetical protein